MPRLSGDVELPYVKELGSSKASNLWKLSQENAFKF